MSDTPREYFGGTHWLKSSQVSQLPPTSFRELVEQCFNTPVPMKIKRSDYRKLDKDTRDEMKAGAYIIACSMRVSPSHRNDENADKVQLLCFDIDDAELARDFFESPATIGEALAGLNFVAYTTANHTPEMPRVRIIVDVDPCLPKYHKLMVRHVANLFGFPLTWSGGRESKTLSLPMARPVQFIGEEFTAVLASRCNAEPLEWTEIPEETMEEVARTYAYQGDPDAEDSNSLAFLPIFNLKVEDIREVLKAVDPDLDYERWTHVGMALRHQFREEEDAREAFELFDEWSQGIDETSTKYRGEKETWAKWKSFKPEAPGRYPITVRSLFKIAMDLGWENTKIATKIQESIEEWLASCTDKATLLEEGCKRISTLPFKNEVVEEALVMALQDRIRAVSKAKIDKTTIKRQVSRLRNLKRKEEDDGNMPNWLRPWYYVSILDQMYNGITGDLLKPEAFNRTFGKEQMPQDENDDAMRTGKPLVLPMDFALNIKETPKVSGILYDPRKSTAMFAHGGRTFVNLFRASTVPKETKKNSAWVKKVIKHHLATIIKEPWLQDLVFDWMAWVVQNPGKKCRWCIVIQSVEGAGKTVLLELLRAALGKENVKSVSPAAMAEPKFNDWLCNAQVIGFEEMWVQGGDRANILNRLKEAITNSTLMVIAKYCPPVYIDNVANFIAFTNHHNALPLTAGNRRYTLIESCIQSEEAAVALADSGHYEPIVKCFTKYPGAVRHCFLNHKVADSFNPDGRAPVTSYGLSVIESSKNPLLRGIETELRAGDPRIAADVIDLSVLTDKVELLTRNNYRPEHYLKSLGYVPHDNGAEFPVNGHRTSVWTHRENYDPYFGDPVEILEHRTKRFHEKEL